LAPILKASLVTLKIAGGVSGLPVPPMFESTLDFLPQYESMLSDVMEDDDLKAIVDSMNELEVYKEMDKFVVGDRVEWLAESNAAQLKQLTGESYRFFSEEARKPENLQKWESLMRIEKIQDQLVWVAKNDAISDWVVPEWTATEFEVREEQKDCTFCVIS